MHRSVRITLPATILLAAPVLCHASSFGLLEQSTSRMGTAFAGTAAAADDATTVFFNPAGLASLKQAEFAAVISGIEITSEFRNGNSQPAFAQPLGNEGGDAGDWNLVPALYIATPLTEKVAVGFGINAPFGLKLEYDDGWMGRFQALDSEIKTYNFNPTIAYRINPQLSVGVGLNYQRLQAELTNAVNYSAVVAQGVQQLVATGQLSPAAAAGVLAANVGLEGHAAVRGDDDAWGWNIGVLFELSENKRIGLAYRSSLDYEVTGTVRFTAPTTTNPIGAGIIAGASAIGAPLSSGPASVDLEVPDSASISLQQALGEKIELLADVAWTGWSTIQELRVVREDGTTVSVTPEIWDDTWRFSLGATYEFSPSLKLRGGVAYDETSVPDPTRTPRLPDADRKWVALGAHWSASPSIGVDFAYAHLFTETVPLNQDAGNVAASGLLVGEQRSDIDIVSMQLSYRF